MGQAQSREANGVKCVECGCGLPSNNWGSVHLGEVGCVRVFYVSRRDEVEFVSSLDMEAGKDGISFGLGTQRKTQNVNLIQYIHNEHKKDGYTCLNCMVENCRAGYPGWDRVVREVNSLMQQHGIKVETVAINPYTPDAPMCLLRPG